MGDNMSLSSLLQIIDHTSNMPQKIIIAITANDINMIPSVLLRPGRFDLKFEVGNCNNDIIDQLFDIHLPNTDSIFIEKFKNNHNESIQKLSLSRV